ncbi:hypothetical protein LTR09_010124 [Extremus antarcticus]|uniref:Uncharacterized protein n=1 Tax=Extremus antarcticus TaxID=702011 RepID=A0AAJ0D7S4_9PEZI|nr:hypothetical protein LTR09_010124 [Extremus antarcticus]
MASSVNRPKQIKPVWVYEMIEKTTVEQANRKTREKKNKTIVKVMREVSRKEEDALENLQGRIIL